MHSKLPTTGLFDCHVFNTSFSCGYKDFLYDLCCYMLRCTRCKTTLINTSCLLWSYRMKTLISLLRMSSCNKVKSLNSSRCYLQLRCGRETRGGLRSSPFYFVIIFYFLIINSKYEHIPNFHPRGNGQ